MAYGDVFSFNDIVGDRTSARGYKTAVNGRGVKAMGGGVAQVATTLYLALQKLTASITSKSGSTATATPGTTYSPGR